MRRASARWTVPVVLAVALACVGRLPTSTADVAAEDEGPATAPVEIARYTSETTQVFALPDGRFRLVSHQQPVRTRQDGHWVPIDTTLVQAGDGSWSPRATSVALTLSDGASDSPLLTMGEDGAQVAMHWEEDLPAPTAEGSSLTYADVRPGVDLVMTAQPRGY